MALALLGIRLLLAVVFAVAGFSKLADRPRFARAMTALGAPAAVAPGAATLVPLLEIATAGSLLAAASARAGALASVVLLTVFSAVVALNLARGRQADCACFGAAGAEPIGAATLLRNAVLLLLAAIVLLRGPGGEILSVAEWQRGSADDRLLGLGLIGLAVIGLATTMLAGRLSAEHHRLTARLTALERAARPVPAHDLGAGGLDVGTAAPPFDLPRLEGDRASLASLSAGGRPVALLFVSAHCPACHDLWPDVERWQRGNRVTVAAIGSGSPQTLELKLMGFSVANTLLEGDAHVGEAYALSLRPSAVMVVDGRIASASVAGVGAIRDLVERWTGEEGRS